MFNSEKMFAGNAESTNEKEMTPKCELAAKLVDALPTTAEEVRKRLAQNGFAHNESN
jgi:hypothetical protein